MHGPAVDDRGQARAGAEVRDHGASERFRTEPVEHGLVREAVKAVALQPGGVEPRGDRQAPGRVRKRPAEGRVETADLWHAGEALARRGHEAERDRQVQRRERPPAIELGERRAVEQGRPVVVRAAVDEPVADRRRRAGQRLELEHTVEGGGVIGRVDDALTCLVRDQRVAADALDRGARDGVQSSVALALGHRHAQ